MDEQDESIRYDTLLIIRGKIHVNDNYAYALADRVVIGIRGNMGIDGRYVFYHKQKICFISRYDTFVCSKMA